MKEFLLLYIYIYKKHMSNVCNILLYILVNLIFFRDVVELKFVVLFSAYPNNKLGLSFYIT